MRLKFIIGKLFALVALTSMSVSAKTPEQLYQSCIACHGQQGEGNSAVNAPAIAGQYAWYTQRQLQNFISGVRGSHEKDTLGQQMRAMTTQLEPNKDFPALADYIANLPGKPQAQQVTGDMMNGSRYYQAKCGACHGGKAEGNKSFNAPRLAGQNIDYLQRQMQNFVAGVRGGDKADKLGKQMAMMAKIVSEKALNDIMFYIAQQK